MVNEYGTKFMVWGGKECQPGAVFIVKMQDQKDLVFERVQAFMYAKN